MVDGERPNLRLHVSASVIFRGITKTVAFSLVVAVLLEFGTLAGAPLLTPFNPEHWRLKRLAIFAASTVAIILVRKLTYDDDSLGVCHKLRHCLMAMNARRQTALALGVAICIPVLMVLISTLMTMTASESFDLRPVVMVLSLCVAAVLLIRLRHILIDKVEVGFLVLSLSFGIIACTCMPVIAEVAWDGQIHFDFANALSYVLDAEYTGADKVMVRPDAVEILNLKDSGDIAALWNPKQDAYSVARANAALRDLDELDITACVETGTLSGSSTVSQTTIGYIPHAVGLWLGRLLSLSAPARYFLARLVSVMTYSAIFYLAIRRLRSGKSIVAAIGLLPTPLLSAANFSYDPWCFAWITYSVARYISVLQQGRMRRCDACAILLSFVAGALVKAVLFPLLLLYLLAPRRIFGSRGDERLFRLATVLSAVVLLASFVIPFLVSGRGGNDQRAQGDVNSSAQLAFILSNPLEYAMTLLNFCLGFVSPLNTVAFNNALTGFPYLTFDASRVGITAALELGLIVVCTVIDRDNDDRAYRGAVPKIASTIGMASALGLIVTALYVAFTPVGSHSVEGVQQRYLLPLFSFMFLVLLNVRTFPHGGVRRLHLLLFPFGELMLLAATSALMFVVAF